MRAWAYLICRAAVTTQRHAVVNIVDADVGNAHIHQLSAAAVCSAVFGNKAFVLLRAYRVSLIRYQDVAVAQNDLAAHEGVCLKPRERSAVGPCVTAVGADHNDRAPVEKLPVVQRQICLDAVVKAGDLGAVYGASVFGIYRDGLAPCRAVVIAVKKVNAVSWSRLVCIAAP